MNKIKKGIAILLCMAMCIPSLQVSAGSKAVSDAGVPASTLENTSDEVRYNTGGYEYCVADESKLDALKASFMQTYGVSVEDTEGYAQNIQAAAAARELEHYTVYDLDGRHRISVETDAFFPYEVQFTYGGKTWSEWFLTRDDTVQVGGHEFYLDAPVTGNTVTQISLNVGGDTVDVYPQQKEFLNEEGGQAGEVSLLPLKEVRLTAALANYTPAELTKVSFEKILTGDTALSSDAFVMWRMADGNDSDYQISSIKDAVDLSQGSGYGSFEMIAGKPDQLAADNVRYLVSVNGSSYDWLVSSVYTDDGGRKAVDAECSYFNSTEYTYDENGNQHRQNVHQLSVRILEQAEKSSYFASLKLNTENYQKGNDFSVKVFEGACTEENLNSAADITGKIWDVDMSAAGSGYPVTPNEDQWITIVTYSGGNITGCLPVLVRTYIVRTYVSISSYLYQSDGKGGFDTAGNSVQYASRTENQIILNEYTYRLYENHPADGDYLVRFSCSKNGEDDSARSDLTAYAGLYDSDAKAKAAGAENIKDQLFGDGYPYRQGAVYSIFLGSDAKQEAYHYSVKIMEDSDDTSSGQPALSGLTNVTFRSVLTGTENSLEDTNAYFSDFDSYGDNNFYTIFVNKETKNGTAIDLSRLALRFSAGRGVTLYQGKSATGTPVESEKTLVDFSKGMVQFTAVSENKENSENYYVRVLQAKDEKDTDGEEPQLYINSLEHESAQMDPDADGVPWSLREIILDSHHENRHDILVVNAGVTTMSALTAVLTSDYLEMDEYWDLDSQDSELAGFTTATKTPGLVYGALPNLAKLRLRAKSDDIEPNDYDDLGTIVFKSGTKTLLKLKLKGTIGDPHITTENEDIKLPAKYVPYGTVIENSNIYTYKNRVFYTHTGQLPKGMFLAASGELYGVPMETGTFTFEVTLHNTYGNLKNTSKTFQLTVRENSDANVEDAQDTGYQLDLKIRDIYDRDADGNYQIRSVGAFGEFFDLYIDGEKLVKNTDYWASEGSTRITIASQSLKKTAGTHTIGVEFHKDRKDKHIRAGAQNYSVSSSGSSGGSSSGGSSSGGSSGGSYYPGSSSKPVKPSDPGNSNEGSTPSVPEGSTDPVTPVTPQQPQPPEPAVSKVMQHAKTYTVKDGDTLMSIAKKYYGRAGLWKRIYDANKDKIPASKKLKKGMKLIIPALSYTVKEGETIKDIAKKYFGGQSKWKMIYEANRDVIPSSKKLKAGDKLVIPVPVCRTLYKTVKGDTLESIAMEFYGDASRWQKIYEANKNKVSASVSKKVKAGKILLIPAMAYTVKKGDTTKSIAKKYYGAQSKWKMIYEANKDVIPTSQKLNTGDKLVLPAPLCRTVYTVQKGDTLESISKKFYGKSSKGQKIYNANTNKIPASKKVKAGRKLIIPAVNYTAGKGDDLKSLAKKYYGTKSSWTKIYQVNRDVIPASKKLPGGNEAGDTGSGSDLTESGNIGAGIYLETDNQ